MAAGNAPACPGAGEGRVIGGSDVRPWSGTGRASRGFSLVELMLALTLGLMVIAGAVQLFAGARQSHASLQSGARVQESGRYALAFMEHSARNAGFLGCNGSRGRIVNTLNGDLDALFELNVTRAVEAFDNDGGGSATAFAAAAGIDHDRIVPGTDMVAFRRVEAPLHRVSAPVDPDGNPVVEDRKTFDLEADDFLLIGDCEQSSLFRLTGVIRGAGRLTLLRGRGAGVFENSPAKPLSEAGKVYGPAGEGGGATVGRVVTETYFIARGRGVDHRGERSRSLWRRAGTAMPAELVEGIHDLQVSFAVDTRPGDGVAATSRHVGIDEMPAGGIIRAIHVRIAAGDPANLRAFGQTFGLRNAG